MANEDKAWTAGEISKLTMSAGDLAKGLSENAVAALLQKGRIERFAKGQTILERDTGVAKFFLALEGTARLVALTEDGREFVSGFMGPGRVWGVHPCLDETPESYDTHAESACAVLVVESKDLRDLMWQNRELQEAMTKILCRRLKLALTVLEQFATWSPRQRLAWRILQIVDGGMGVGAEFGRHSIAISQDAIAAMIGLSRQRTNKLLKEFEREGFVRIDYGSIRVIEPGGLKIVLKDLS